MYSLRAESYSLSNVAAAGTIRVAPSRRQIGGGEPTVGFTIVTDRPFAELIVATDPGQLTPEARDGRSAATYFASREHGLSRGPGEIVFMLPAAVVRTMVSRTPAPRRIYYLAVGYDDEQGANPVYSVPAQRWSTDLPSIDIDPDLNAAAIAHTLGMAIERLSRGDDRTVSPYGHDGADAPPLTASLTDPRGTWQWATTGRLGAPQVVALDVAGNEDDEDEGDAASAYDHDDGSPVDPGERRNDHDAPSNPNEAIYDDGYDSVAGASLDGSYGHGSAEPAELPDDESWPSYGDEADLEAGAQSTVVPGPPATATLNAILDELALPLAPRDPPLYEKAATSGGDLSWGLMRWSRRSGDLWRVAERMRQADAAAFAHLLASHVDTLRNADVDPSEDALRALAEAGRQPAFIEVQRAIAREDLLPRIVHVARDMDIASARGVAMLACVALASSVDDGLAWVLSGIGPASTPALLDSALRAVGDADLEAFQRRMQIPATGALDVRTHARLTASLRALGPRSPIPVRSGRQALETLLRQAEAQGRGVVAKLASLWQSPRLADGEI